MKIVKTSLTVETTFSSLRSLEHELGMVYHCGVCLADNEDHSIQTEAGWSTVEDELEELHENGMLSEELYRIPPRKPLPLGMGMNRHVRRDDLRKLSCKTTKFLL